MNKRVIKIALLSVVLSGAMASCQKESEMELSQELSQKLLAQETSILFFKIDCASYYKSNNQ